MCVRVYVCVYLCACVLKFCVCVYLGQAQAYSFLEIGLLSASVCVFSYALCSAAWSRFQMSNTLFKQIQICIWSKFKYTFRKNTNTSAAQSSFQKTNTHFRQMKIYMQQIQIYIQKKYKRVCLFLCVFLCTLLWCSIKISYQCLPLH